MDSNPIQQNLLLNTNTHNSYYEEDGGHYSVKVIEYMLSSMSNELLTKFPDNSAFDFDYTQSSIWSPLLPHPSNPSSPSPELQRKLSYEDEGEMMVVKKCKENVEDKKSGSGLFSCFKGENYGFTSSKKKKKGVVMKRKRSSFRGFDHLGSNSSSVDQVCSSPFQSKVKQGWKKVLKAASKQFKRTMKKKDSGAQLKLSSNVHSQFTYYY